MLDITPDGKVVDRVAIPDAVVIAIALLIIGTPILFKKAILVF
jgi:hypothetical protein